MLGRISLYITIAGSRQLDVSRQLDGPPQDQLSHAQRKFARMREAHDRVTDSWT